MKSNTADVQLDALGNILLVTNTLHISPNGGRELLCKLNYEVLLGMKGRNFFLYELSQAGVTDFSSMLEAFKGHIDGLSCSSISSIIDKIRAEKIDFLFIDGSNLGELARCARHEFPKLKILTFFHNVEAIFFWDAFKNTKSIRSAAVCMVNYFAERKAVKFSDYLVSLSERDSQMLNSLYGRQATGISSMAVKDTHEKSPDVNLEGKFGKYALFVGGVFFANLSGILWYAKHVAPYINIKTLVVGRGFELYKDQIESCGNMVVIGGVDSIADWYRSSAFVVAPIFGGSGMKTKVAEALMYGKLVVGTTEAFSGYEIITNRVGCVCKDAEQFITAIEAVCACDNVSFDMGLREIYENRYSIGAARKRLLEIMSGSG